MVRIVRNGYTSEKHFCEWCGSMGDGRGPHPLFQIQALLEDKLEPKRFNVCDGCLNELGLWIQGVLKDLEPEKKARDDVWEKSMKLQLLRTSARKKRPRKRRPAVGKASSQRKQAAVDTRKRGAQKRRK